MSTPQENPRTGQFSEFTRWLRENAHRLETIDPSADVGDSGSADLAPLAAMVQDARVVAVGENSHFISEFALVRHRLVRFLVEECGFTAVAFESGFSEGFAIDEWTRGGGELADLDRLAEYNIPSGTARPKEVRDILCWLREYNGHSANATTPVQFLGVDVPEAAGAVLNSLDPVITFAEEVDPALLPLLRRTRELAKIPAGRTMAHAAPRYLEMPDDQRDALTAGISRLIDYVDCVADRYIAVVSQERFDVVRWHLEAARSGDHHLRAIASAYDGTALPASATSRERFMAASVRWWLERLGPDAKIVLLAHNAHIQRTPVVYEGELQVYPMGYHLGRDLGDEYVSVGVTSSTGTTAALEPDGSAEPYGFRVDALQLEEPEDGSVEAAFTDSGADLSLAVLRGFREGENGEGSHAALPDRVRMDSDYIHTPVIEAFDAMVHVPTSTVAEDLGL
ncbi:MAG TPA: erythromycin esterase family protein [Candidatus Corynebacterium avicola]|uniref:Erythromycin esterase family protein n=1 Tax=Candidatus Corynebacterium avicola TaxID=2838527 RepID=A0A9D1RN02_9CORY|nr:erythromycin esterase family protein [Candidatus Corynebacterium avicola]